MQKLLTHYLIKAEEEMTKQKEINLCWQTTSYGQYNHHYQTHWNLARLEKQPSKERESVKNKNTHERGN